MNKRQYKKWLSKRCKHSYADARCQMIKDYIKTYGDECNMYYILDSRRGGYKHILKIVGFEKCTLENINNITIVNDEETTDDYSFSCESNGNVVDMLNRWKEAVYDENQQTNIRSDKS